MTPNPRHSCGRAFETVYTPVNRRRTGFIENYRCVVTTPHGESDVDACVRKIATGLHRRLPELTSDIAHLMQHEIPELGGDVGTAELFDAGISGNVDTVLHSMRYGIDVLRIEAPTAAMEHARRLAQHGVPVHALVRAYRLGQRRMNELVFAEVQMTDMDPLVRVGVLEKMSTALFAYIDWISQQVVETYEGERERWLENQGSIRALRVREILASQSAVDIDATTSTIRYPLRWHHLALVVWSPDAAAEADELPRLQRFVRDMSKAAGSADSLFIAADRVTGWGWLPFRADTPQAIERVRQFAGTHANPPSVAIGAVAAGVDGFRNSHRQASAAHAVAAARRPHQHAVIAAEDPGVLAVALLVGNLGQAREWVAGVLGDLAADTDNDARLRETLRIFLSTRGSRKLAAERLNLHSNTVRYRVDRAITRRGRDIGVDRFDVELALLLCHWYGTAVLVPQN